ncbi:MAG: YkgJ family cysteine cluster protein [Candidatus Lernaella stagnicola]|nr:YkgJ family cysteine cluster protein [Candidatus Lernaella stagnicola]
MALIDTPWGAIRVPDDIPLTISCARCGTCCRAFFLSVTDETLREWQARRDAGDTAGLPPDLDAVLDLFVPLDDPPPTAEGSWFTCRAFDPDRNVCTLFETDPNFRPQACFAFPYIYDWASLHEAPYADCHIVREAVRHLGAGLGANFITWVRTRRGW